jgi:hypothetical protein
LWLPKLSKFKKMLVTLALYLPGYQLFYYSLFFCFHTLSFYGVDQSHGLRYE